MSSTAPEPSVEDEILNLKILVRRLYIIKKLISTPHYQASSLLDYLLTLAKKNREIHNQDSLGFRSIDEIITEAIIKENIKALKETT